MCFATNVSSTHFGLVKNGESTRVITRRRAEIVLFAESHCRVWIIRGREGISFRYNSN